MTEKNNAVKQNSNKSRKRLNKLVAALACLCVLLTGYLMMQPALSENVDIKDYVEDQKPYGRLYLTLDDKDGKEVAKDDDGNYIVVAGTVYEMSLTIQAPNGFVPGTYTYQFPQGLMVASNQGEFIVEGVKIGEWSITSDGILICDFNAESDYHSGVVIDATMDVAFNESDTSMDFDGMINVVIKKPPAEDAPTEVLKWGHPGSADAGEDPTKIYWTFTLTGHKDSNIPGSVITDSINEGAHGYTSSDMEGGLYIGFNGKDASGASVWHEWYVYPGDPNLVWTEDGWTYMMPTICQHCNNLTLGNDGWVYFFNYTSTPDPTSHIGAITYSNKVTTEGQTSYGYVNFMHGKTSAVVDKTGAFMGDEDGGGFVWSVDITIPGKVDGEKAVYAWYLFDRMYLQDTNVWTLTPFANDMLKGTVTATRGGNTIEVPNIADVTDADEIAWRSGWSDSSNGGVTYHHEIELINRCHCTEENCSTWNNGCWSVVGENSDFCSCWNVVGDTTFHFDYETEDLSLVEEYGGKGYLLLNNVELYHRPPGEWDGSVKVGTDTATVDVPGLFKKELTKEYDGYTASYTITVNEAKVELVEDGTPLIIHDIMTETLTFISGSLRITAVDAEGKETALEYGKDFITTYDGSGDVTDASGNKVHVLDIQINDPQPVMYVLKYDATLVFPDVLGEELPTYSNSATITIFGKQITSDSAQMKVSSFNYSAESYKVDLVKVDSKTGGFLPGAVFGLYNEEDGLIKTAETDENGKLTFKTKITEGVILSAHTPYYIKELESPDGYVLDDTKYWFYFCKGKENDPQYQEYNNCNEDPKLKDLTKITGKVENQAIETIVVGNVAVEYVLPDAGGGGARIFVIAGMTLVIGSAAALAIRRRKQYNM